MRLTDDQIVSIKKVMSELLTARPILIYLYGSRTNDSLRGGDIDLVVVHPQSWPPSDEEKLFALQAALKKSPSIGDRKINVSLVTTTELQQDPFWQSIQVMVQLTELK